MVISKLIKFVDTLITLLKSVRLFLLFKKVGSARLKDSGIHPISPNTSAPQYQPVDRKKRKGKRVEFYSWDGAAYANKEALALLLNSASPTPHPHHVVFTVVFTVVFSLYHYRNQKFQPSAN